MAIKPFLAINSRNGTPQVKRYINASPANIGVAISGAVIDTDATTLGDNRGYPAVVKFGGSQTFLATIGLDIYRSTDGGASWTSVKTFTAGTHISSSYSVAKSGLFVLYNAGVATAVIITHNQASANYYAHTSTNGTTWTTSGPFTAAASAVFRPLDSVAWDGKLVTWWNSTGALNVSTIFDPVVATMTITSRTTGGLFSAALTVFNNALYALLHDGNAGGTYYLDKFVAGAWVNQQTVSSFGNTNTTSKECLFVDGTNMIAFISTGTAWKAFRWDSGLTQTEITSSVVPTALASGLSASQRMSVIVDSAGTPGSAPSIWIYQSVDGGAATALNQWKWNGISSYIGDTPGSTSSASNDSGGSARDSLPFVQHAQGATFWTSGEDYVEEKGTSPTPGGITVTFTLYSDTGSGTASIRAWRGVSTDEYPLAAATLTGTLTGLAKDNSTVHSIVWNAVADGFSAGDRSKFVLEKY